jgi:hypothetical protein
MKTKIVSFAVGDVVSFTKDYKQVPKVVEFAAGERLVITNNEPTSERNYQINGSNFWYSFNDLELVSRATKETLEEVRMLLGAPHD